MNRGARSLSYSKHQQSNGLIADHYSKVQNGINEQRDMKGMTIR